MKEQSSEIIVNDRRMFNRDGSLRENLQQSDISTTNSPTPSEPVEEQSKQNTQPKEKKQGISQPFYNLLSMLTTNALISLGGDVRFGRGGVDLETARQFTDMLSSLKEKTAGNLSEEEESILNEMVSRLEMEYVSVANQISMSAKK
ncbi:MAG: DUF1844 domain-containing protein [Blastocatellia bacterium]|nr:DUF1844 domain-containing protein [Blastocatellia bacterium]